MVSRPPRHRKVVAMDRTRTGFGVEELFWANWREHEPFLERLCTGWLRGTPLDVQEVLSSGMLKAWDAAQNTVDEIGNYKAWLAKVLRNHCIDQQRKLSRDMQVWALADLHLPLVERNPSNALPSPEAMLLRDESYHRLIAGMEVLPDRLREVMILRATQDMAYDEIGRRLHISGDNARKRVQLARERLRRHAPLPGTEVPEHEREVTEAILAQERLDLGPAPCHVEPVAMCMDGIMVEVPVYHRLRPSRLQQKADTVGRYLVRHDAGWRKECEYAQLLWALGDPQGALERMAAARLRHPEVVELTVVHLRLLAGIGAWKRAAAVAAEALEEDGTSEIQGLLRGFVALGIGEHDRAIREFQQLAAVLRWPMVTLVAMAAGNLGMARQQVEEWLDRCPIDREAWVAKVAVAGRAEWAGWVEASLRRFPHDPFAQAYALVGMQVQGRFGEISESRLQRLARRIPGTFLLAATKAAIHYHRGEGGAALRTIAAFLRQNPPHVQAQRFAIRLAQKLGKPMPRLAPMITMDLLAEADLDLPQGSHLDFLEAGI